MANNFIMGNPISIKGNLKRPDIVKQIINIFIDHEREQRGHGVKFRYQVEQLSNGTSLYIQRPGGLQKWNFDFKVIVEEEYGLGTGKHQDLYEDFEMKQEENPEMFINLMAALTEVYTCSECDVDLVISKYNRLHDSFKSGTKIDILLKVIKWMFIMEDIVYWNYKGRTKLYEYINELSNE